jgi:hypothetical protein
MTREMTNDQTRMTNECPMHNDQLGIRIWSFIGHSGFGIGHLFRCITRLVLFAAVFGCASCKTTVEPKVPILDGAYYLIPLNDTVRIQRNPDWSIRVDAIDQKQGTCRIEVISGTEATPNVATLRQDEALPDIPGLGKMLGHKPTGAVVQIRNNTVKVWANTQ